MAKAAKKTSRSAKKAAKQPGKRAGTRRIPGHPYPEPEATRVRTAKGRRPCFFDDPNIDKLLAMIMALAGEVSVIRERVDTHERLARESTWATHEAIEDYEPDEVAEAFRAQWRRDYIARVLRIVQVELDHIASGGTHEGYDKIVEDVSK